MARQIYVPQAGRVIDFKDDATDDQIQAYIQQTYMAPQQAAPTPPPQTERGLWNAFSSGIDDLQAIGYVDAGKAAQGIESLAGFDNSWSEYFYKKAMENSAEGKKYQPGDVWGASGIGEGAYSLIENIAKSAPSSAPGIIAGGVGTVYGGPRAGGAAMTAVNYPINFGQNILRQQEEQNIPLRDTSAAVAGAAAVPQTALDLFGGKLILKGILPSGITRSELGKAILDLGERGIVAKVGTAAVGEGATEALQQAIEIGQANPEKLFEFDHETQMELINAATIGAGMSGVFSAAVEPVAQYSQKKATEKFKQLDDDLAAEAEQGRLEAERAEISTGLDALSKAAPEGRLDIAGISVKRDENDPTSDTADAVVLSFKGKPIATFTSPETAQKAVNEYKARTNANITLATDEVDKFFGTAPKLPEETAPEAITDAGQEAPSLQHSGTAEKIEAPKADIAPVAPEPIATPEAKADAAQPEAPKLTEAPSRPSLMPIPYKSTSLDPKTGKKITKEGKSDVIDYAGRKMVVVDVNGHKVPFYLSTGLAGKAGVPAGKWYPFLGIGQNWGWVNKASSEQIARYYDSPELKSIGESLDATVGDIRASANEPRVSNKGPHADFINEGLNPAENEDADAAEKVAQSLDVVQKRLKAGQKLAPTPTTNETFEDVSDAEARLAEFEAAQKGREEMMADPEAVARKAAEVGVSPAQMEQFTEEQYAKTARDIQGLKSVMPEKPVNRVLQNDAIRKGVIDRLRSIVPNKRFEVNFESVIKGENIPDAIIDQRSPRGVATVTKDFEGTKFIVTLATDTIFDPKLTVDQNVQKVIDVFNHEIVHSLYNSGVLTKNEQAMLGRAARATKRPGKKYTYFERAMATYGEIYSQRYATPQEFNAAIEEEAVAEMFREWTKNPKAADVRVRPLLNRILQFFRRLFGGLKTEAAHDLFKRIESGEVGERAIAREAGVSQDGKFSIAPKYNPRTSTSQWEKGGAPPPGVNSVNLTKGSPYRISQRRPTAVGRERESLDNNLMINTAAMKQSPKAYVHNVGILNSYPNMRVVEGEDPDQTLKRFKEHAIQNLLWLHDAMDPALRVRAKKWYDGAREITTALAQKYDLPDTTVAAVLAGLSPQKDWFQNVSLAERLIDIVVTKQNEPFSDAMMDILRNTKSMAKYAHLFDYLEGKTLAEIASFDPAAYLAGKHNEIAAGVFSAETANKIAEGVRDYGQAIFVRFYDEANFSRNYNIITPEGGKGQIATTGKGTPAKVAWGSFGEIGKGIEAIRSGNKETIDEVLGDKHKIRNFYNNIISPNSTDGSVTIDTHAVAAALLRPLAGGSDEVHHNFGTSVPEVVLKTKNSEVTGVQGLYAFYADVYREAAKRRGILPREMQSIAWEAVRGMYKPTFKAQAKNVDAIDAVWNNYKSGRITVDEARKQVLEYADPGAVGINNPFWKNTPGNIVYAGAGPTLNAGGVGRLGVRQAAGGTRSGGTRGNAGVSKPKFDVAPPVKSNDFAKWFSGSVVANSDGSPRVMYHGTKRDYDEFDTTLSEMGTHFGTARHANEFVIRDPDRLEAEADAFASGKRSDRIIPVYLSIKNPLRLFDKGRWLPREVLDQLKAMGLATREDYKPLDGLPIDGTRTIKYLQGIIKRAGYDGIVYLNRYEGFEPDPIRINGERAGMTDDQFRQKYPDASDSYITFDRQQAKSVNNPFTRKTILSAKFSLAPDRPEVRSTDYVEQQNAGLFAQEPVKGSVFKRVMQYFYGPYKKGTLADAFRVHMVDEDQRILTRESEANVGKMSPGATGEYRRFKARYSAYVALQMAERSAHVASAVLRKGAPTINMENGDINSAYLDVQNDPDNIKNVIKLLADGPVNADGQKQSLMNVFRDYSIALRGHRLDKEGKMIPNDKRWEREALATGRKYQNVLDAHAMYQRFNRKLLKAALDSGLIKADQFSRFTDSMDYYGFYRTFGQDFVAQPNGKKMAGDIKVMPYKGSEMGELANDPVMVMVHNANFWIGAIMRNLAAQKSLNLLQRMGEARELKTGEDPDPMRQEEDEVLYAKVNGVTKRYAVTDYLLLKSLGADETLDMPKMLQLAGIPSKFLREMVTRDPRFIVANMARDTLASWIVRGESVTPVISTLIGMKKGVSGSQEAERLESFGIIGSYDEATRSAKDIGDAVKRDALGEKILDVSNPKGAGKALWHLMGRLSDASDAASRIPIYEAVLKETGDEFEAAFRALEVINFSRHGASTTLRIFTKIIPFLNARIQGFDVLYQGVASGVRYATGNARGEMDARMGARVLIRGAILAAIAWALEALNDDDPEYKELQPYIKDGNFLLPIGGGKYLSWPKPFEAGFLFGTIPQHVVQHLNGSGSYREDMKLFTSQFANTFGLNPTPQIIAPLVENYFNIDLYTGLPIVSAGQQRLDPSLRYNFSTSKIARMLGDIPITYNMTTGRWEGFSPAYIDNLITGYGGPMGTYLLAVTDALMTGGGIGPDQLPYRSLADMPMIRQFLVDAKSKTPNKVTDAYELFNMVDERVRTFARLRASGDLEAARAYFQENKDILGRKKQITKMINNLDNVRAMQRRIERNNNMTSEQKRAELDKLRQLELAITSAVPQLNAALR